MLRPRNVSRSGGNFLPPSSTRQNDPANQLRQRPFTAAAPLPPLVRIIQERTISTKPSNHSSNQSLEINHHHHNSDQAHIHTQVGGSGPGSGSTASSSGGLPPLFWSGKTPAIGNATATSNSFPAPLEPSTSPKRILDLKRSRKREVAPLLPATSLPSPHPPGKRVAETVTSQEDSVVNPPEAPSVNTHTKPETTATTEASSTTPDYRSHLNPVPLPIFFSTVNGAETKLLKRFGVFTAEGSKMIPSFRVLDQQGLLLKEVEPFRDLDGKGVGRLEDEGLEWVKRGIKELTKEKALRMYKTMALLPILDQILLSFQRQGKIAFWATSLGEEGSVVGSAAAWDDGDEIWTQYRESGLLLYRGWPLSSLFAQVYANHQDVGSGGRQMALHYGCKDLKFHTISSPLGTQIPQAAGAAHALKQIKERGEGRENDCVVCYLGEGASSTGDFHAGLNMAAVLGGPIVYFIRNNGFAISTPSTQQMIGDGVASKGPGYGIESVRVDGNDPLAVYLVCKEAKRRAVEGCKPVLVEAMTYRAGDHSTSDNSSAYRDMSEVDSQKNFNNPIIRFKNFLERKYDYRIDDQQSTTTTSSESLSLFSSSTIGSSSTPTSSFSPRSNDLIGKRGDEEFDEDDEDDEDEEVDIDDTHQYPNSKYSKSPSSSSSPSTSISTSWWSPSEDESLRSHLRNQILEDLEVCEKEENKKRPRLEEMWQGVWGRRDWNTGEEIFMDGPRSFSSSLSTSTSSSANGEFEPKTEIRDITEQKLELKRLVEKWGESSGSWKGEIEKYLDGRKGFLNSR